MLSFFTCYLKIQFYSRRTDLVNPSIKVYSLIESNKLKLQLQAKLQISCPNPRERMKSENMNRPGESFLAGVVRLINPFVPLCKVSNTKP